MLTYTTDITRTIAKLSITTDTRPGIPPEILKKVGEYLPEQRISTTQTMAIDHIAPDILEKEARIASMAHQKAAKLKYLCKINKL